MKQKMTFAVEVVWSDNSASRFSVVFDSCDSVPLADLMWITRGYLSVSDALFAECKDEEGCIVCSYYNSKTM